MMKIRAVHILGLAIITLILQLTLLGFLEINSIKPDLMFLMVVISSLYLPFRQGIIINWCIGALTDMASNSSFGSFALLFMFTGLIISLFRGLFFREDFIIRLGITFLSGFICHLLYGIGLSISLLDTGITLGFYFILIKSFLIALYTTILALFAFFISDRIIAMIRAYRLKRELEG